MVLLQLALIHYTAVLLECRPGSITLQNIIPLHVNLYQRPLVYRQIRHLRQQILDVVLFIKSIQHPLIAVYLLWRYGHYPLIHVKLAVCLVKLAQTQLLCRAVRIPACNPQHKSRCVRCVCYQIVIRPDKRHLPVESLAVEYLPLLPLVVKSHIIKAGIYGNTLLGRTYQRTSYILVI